MGPFLHVLHNMVPAFAWLPNSNEILMIRPSKEAMQPNGEYEICLFDVELQKETPLIGVRLAIGDSIDISPDGESALFVARSAAPLGEPLAKDANFDQHLSVQYRSKKGTPSSSQRLVRPLFTKRESHSRDSGCTIQGKASNAICRRAQAACSVRSAPPNDILLPANGSMRTASPFGTRRRVLGLEGYATYLVTSDVDGRNPPIHQPQIDAAISRKPIHFRFPSMTRIGKRGLTFDLQKFSLRKNALTRERVIYFADELVVRGAWMKGM